MCFSHPGVDRPLLLFEVQPGTCWNGLKNSLSEASLILLWGQPPASDLLGRKPRIKISLVFLWVRNLDSVMAFGVCQRGVAEPFSSEFPPNTFPGRVGVYRTCCWRELEERGRSSFSPKLPPLSKHKQTLLSSGFQEPTCSFLWLFSHLQP